MLLYLKFDQNLHLILVILTLITFISICEFVYAQTAENEIIENTLETVEKATTKGLSEIKESMSNASKSKEYKSEVLGIKLQIPSQWDVMVESNKTKNCFDETHNCFTLITNDHFLSGNVSFTISLEKHLFNGSLKDFVKYRYDYFKTKYKEFTFLNDKELKLKDIPAWQMEYKIDPLGSISKTMTIFTNVNNTYYDLSYTSSKESDYSKYLPEAQNVLNTIEFIPSKPPEVKKPSFLD